MSDRPETLLTRLSTALQVAAVVVLAVLFVVLAAVVPALLDLPGGVSVLAVLLALVVETAAIGLKQYPLTAFGVRSRVGYAVATEGRCEECGDRISTGERRRYTRQVVAFGVPIHTLDWGVNAYCYDCRDDEGEHDRRAHDGSRDREREVA